MKDIIDDKKVDEILEKSVEGFLEKLCEGMTKEQEEDKALIVKKARQETKMTIRELAGVLGVNIEQAASFEHGRAEIPDEYCMAVIFACVARNIVFNSELKEGRCPDCGRKKARSPQDMIMGFCPKWYAVTDAEADKDCERFKVQNNV